MNVHPAWLLPLAAIASGVLTGVLRRFAIARRLLDVPNERSSHTTPTPRGGGVAIVLSFLGGLLALYALGAVDRDLTIALFGSGALVAIIGFLDDRRSQPVALRLATHLTAAIWSLSWLGGLPAVEIGAATIALGWWGDAIAAIGLVWLLNLYNFMDGIDGIAGTEALTVGLSAATLHLVVAPDQLGWLAPALLAMAALGFLAWNWPPARIFMGDAGSGFLGLMLGVLAISAAQVQPRLLWACLILLGVFVVDATVTLLRRAAGADRVYVAHREHAYQHAAQQRTHRAVTISVAAINLLWLFPLALAVASGWIGGIAGLALAYAPLVWLAFRLNAGVSGIIATTSQNA